MEICVYFYHIEICVYVYHILKCENLTYACDDGGKVKKIHNTCTGLYNLTDLNKNVRTFGNVSFCVKEKNKMPIETL